MVARLLYDLRLCDLLLSDLLLSEVEYAPFRSAVMQKAEPELVARRPHAEGAVVALQALVVVQVAIADCSCRSPSGSGS